MQHYQSQAFQLQFLDRVFARGLLQAVALCGYLDSHHKYHPDFHYAADPMALVVLLPVLGKTLVASAMLDEPNWGS